MGKVEVPTPYLDGQLLERLGGELARALPFVWLNEQERQGQEADQRSRVLHHAPRARACLTVACEVG